MSHSSCPTKLPDDVCHILDEFRQALHDNAERPYRTPTPEEGEEDTTPAWREHVAQFTLMPIGRFYARLLNLRCSEDIRVFLLSPRRWWRLTQENYCWNVQGPGFVGVPQARAILRRILYQYLVLGHSKFANLGPEYSWLVYSGLGYFADDDASQVVVDEPIILVYAARQLFLKRYPWDHDESLFSHKLIYNPDQPALASAREHAVLLLSRICATPRGPAEAFIFPGEVAPEWAHRYSDLVELRPGVWNNGNARYRTARHAEYPASAVLPLATDGTSYATTLSWLRHEHETAFCLLPDPTAFIFALRRFDGDYLWVIVRVGPSANCGPRKSGLGRYFVSKDKTADTSEALSILASLPNPCKALGDLPVLEVAMPIPDPNAPNRLERLNHRRYESPYGSPRSPRPTEYRTVTVNPTLVQFTEAVLEEAMLTEREDEESWILSRMVANVVGETSISPDRHGRRRKVVSQIAQSDVRESIRLPRNLARRQLGWKTCRRIHHLSQARNMALNWN
ncbi:hypothetical protein K523DRAFT_353454 [Schizophyllum commune Tattone D]|nr:hypothetical protein K523DRAFT_353454 [Schizophyllum commune Tattone D]